MRAMLFLLALLAASGAAAQVPIDSLAGAWIVDLRPSPEASFTAAALVVDSVAVDGSFVATFRGMPVQSATITEAWGETRFAFASFDAATTYHTTGVLRDGWLEGTTHAIGQTSFASGPLALTYWTATRDPATPPDSD